MFRLQFIVMILLCDFCLNFDFVFLYLCCCCFFFFLRFVFFFSSVECGLLRFDRDSSSTSLWWKLHKSEKNMWDLEWNVYAPYILYNMNQKIGTKHNTIAISFIKYQSRFSFFFHLHENNSSFSVSFVRMSACDSTAVQQDSNQSSGASHCVYLYALSSLVDASICTICLFFLFISLHFSIKKKQRQNKLNIKLCVIACVSEYLVLISLFFHPFDTVLIPCVLLTPNRRQFFYITRLCKMCGCSLKSGNIVIELFQAVASWLQKKTYQLEGIKINGRHQIDSEIIYARLGHFCVESKVQMPMEFHFITQSIF